VSVTRTPDICTRACGEVWEKGECPRGKVHFTSKKKEKKKRKPHTRWWEWTGGRRGECAISKMSRPFLKKRRKQDCLKEAFEREGGSVMARRIKKVIRRSDGGKKKERGMVRRWGWGT